MSYMERPEAEIGLRRHMFTRPWTHECCSVPGKDEEREKKGVKTSDHSVLLSQAGNYEYCVQIARWKSGGKRVGKSYGQGLVLTVLTFASFGGLNG